MVFLGIGADLYTLAEDAYGPPNENNSCYDHPDYKKYQGLQNISPCQYGKIGVIVDGDRLLTSYICRGSRVHL